MASILCQIDPTLKPHLKGWQEGYGRRVIWKAFIPLAEGAEASGFWADDWSIGEGDFLVKKKDRERSFFDTEKD